MADKNLVAKIILSATDKASSAMNRVRLHASGLTRQLATLQNKQRAMAKTQTLARSFRDTRLELNASTIAIKNHQQKLRLLSARMTAAKQPTKAMAREYRHLAREMDGLIRRKQKLTSKVGELSERLKKAGFDTKNFANSYRTLHRNLKQSTADIDKQKAALQRLSTARARVDRANEIAGKARSIGVKTGAAASTVGIGVGATVRSGMTEEDAMLDIVKQVDGLKNKDGSLNAEAIKAMRLEVQDLSRQLPLTTENIMQMYAAGARMGTARDGLKDFVTTAAQAAVAFDADNAGELAENFGKIAKNFKLSAEGAKDLADRINYLDDNAISKGQDIIGFMNRVAGTVGMAKIETQNMAALGSTLLTLGSAESDAATSVSFIFSQLGSASALPAVRKSLEQIGLEAKDIQNGMVTDAQATIMKVVEALKKIPESERQAILTKMIGRNHLGVMQKLVTNTEEWRRQIQLANSEAAKGSMAREFAVRMQSASSKWQVLKNQIFNVSAAAGNALFTTLNGIMDKATELLAIVAKWQQNNPQAMAAIMKTVSVLGLALAGISAISLAIGAVLTPIAMLRKAFTALSVVMRFNPIVLGITIVVGAIILMIKYWSQLKEFMVNAWQSIDKIFSNNPILNFIFLPIGAIRLFLATWDKFKNSLSTAWNSIKQLFSNNPLQNISILPAGTSELIAGSWEKIKSTCVSGWNSLRQIFSNSPMQNFSLLCNGAFDLVSAGWDKLKNSFLSGWNWINQLFSKNPILNFLILPIGLMRLVVNNWDALKNNLIAGWQRIDQAFRNNPILNVIFPVIGAARFLINHWQQIPGFFVGLWSKVRSTVSNAVTNICTSIRNAPLVQSVTQIWNNVMTYLSGLGKRLYDAGVNIMQGLIDGVKAKLKILQDMWHSVAALFDGTMRKTNDIHSPSRVMARLGGYIMQGLVLGIKKGRAALYTTYQQAIGIFQQPIAATAELIQRSAGVLLPLGGLPSQSSSATAPPLAIAGTAGNNTYHITVNVSAGTTAGLGQRIGNDIAQALQRHQAEQQRRARGSMWDKD